MYMRILAAVDGSAHSELALRHAIEAARSTSATLRIVHVMDLGPLLLGPEFAIDIAPIAQARRTEGERILAAARETAQAAGLAAETQLLDTGTPTQHVAEAIAGEAARWRADVVVLGTHGRRGVERLLLGSVAESVARRSVVPVLLVPSRTAP
jgi:nucleotide-binding universal stress UspA family protein